MFIQSTLVVSLLLLNSNVQGQHFQDVTDIIGIDIHSDGYYGNGTSIVDIDKDGLPDLLMTGPSDTLQIYRNLGNWEFELMALDLVVHNAKMISCVDYDRDGDRDLFVSALVDQNYLFRQDSAWTFTEVTLESGFPEVQDESFGHSWADINQDGFLDLMVYNFILTGDVYDNLYLNNGDGTFSDISDSSGLGDYLAPTFIGIFFDQNNDGYPDLFIINDRPSWQNKFWKNNGDLTFTDESDALGLGHYINSMSNTPLDANRDGLLDIFVSNNNDGNVLLIQQENGSFLEEANPRGLSTFEYCWAAQAFDLDNDGWEDLLVSTIPSEGQVTEGFDHLYRNVGDGYFELVEDQPLESLALHNFMLVQGDLDNDGRIDMITHTSAPDSSHFWQNTSDAGNFVSINLQGVISNPDAVGAQVDVYLEDNLIRKWVFAGSDYACQRPFALHFGLGEAAVVDSVKIQWPSGLNDTFLNIPSNQALQFTEGWSSYSNLQVSHSGICPGDSVGIYSSIPGTYSWSDGSTADTLYTSTQGWHTCTTLHPSGFVLATDSVFLSSYPVQDYELSPQVICPWDSTGQLELTSTGATLSWVEPVSPLNLDTGLVAYTVLDVNGCLYSGTVALFAPDSTTMSWDVTSPSCFGYSDGSFAFYSEEVMELALPFDPELLAGGTHSFAATDSVGCSYVLTFTLTEPDPLVVSINPDLDDSASGTLGAVSSGGTPPYTYTWNGAVGDSILVTTGPGGILLEVTDAMGCSETSYLATTDLPNGLEFQLLARFDESGMLHLQLPFPLAAQVYGPDGRLLLDQELSTGTVEGSNRWTPGVYLITWQHKEMRDSQRLVKY